MGAKDGLVTDMGSFDGSAMINSVAQRRLLQGESGNENKKTGTVKNRNRGEFSSKDTAENLRFTEELVASVKKDYIRRGSERLQFESQWQLNRNFVAGNQYCSIGPAGEIEDSDGDYFWQQREVYNHIAPIVETRLAKLMKVRPKMSVMPASGDEDDLKTAKAAGKILNSTYHRLSLDALISKATIWSELTGSVFYKLTWSPTGGRAVGKTADGETIYEGDVEVAVCPPYEIYPDSLAAADISDCNSIIHAKAVNVSDIQRIWGVSVQSEDIDIASLTGGASIGGLGVSSIVPKVGRFKLTDCAIVIERYTRPGIDCPNGELVIIAGNSLLYYGELPYINGSDGTRDLPFIKQDSIINAGCFYGNSVIERAIPIQRAYNAVKNRKHEFLNRICMGVLAVEDGSVDIDNLEEEGLSPGKILIYRQGSTPPQLMKPGNLPPELSYEEDKLLSEFISVSGVSEIMRNSSVPSSVTSGLAIQLLLDQDDTRLATTAERIRDAVKAIAKHILRLYKQFGSETRLARFVGENGEVEIVSWSASDISCDDVVLDTENELSSSKASRQNMIFELLKAGLLQDENGKLSDAARSKVLDALDFGTFELARDTERMHVRRADGENSKALKEFLTVNDVDDHDVHIRQHTKFLIDSGFDKLKKRNPELESRILEHIKEHRAKKTVGEGAMPQ